MGGQAVVSSHEHGRRISDALQVVPRPSDSPGQNEVVVYEKAQKQGEEESLLGSNGWG